MRILQLTNRIPYPLNDGGSIGIHYYIDGYIAAGVELSLLAMNTTRHWVDTGALPGIYARLKDFKTVRIDNRIKPVAALANLFTKRSYHIDRFISKDYEAALVALLRTNEYDVIHLDGIYLTPYVETIRRNSKAKIVLRLHNPEFRIWERLATQAGSGVKAWYLRLLTKRLKDFELANINAYDLVLALSEEDAAFYKAQGCTVPVYVHPFGIDPAEQYGKLTVDSNNLDLEDEKRWAKLAGKVLAPKFYHLGAMDWLPNQESVNWLLEQVWPLVIQEKPDAQLYLAGRAMPAHYFEKTLPGLHVVGEVPDATAFEQDKDVLLVPLLSGGGVRIKIYRGLAAGKAVVTTSIGVEGISAKSGKEVLIADTAPDFARKVIALIENPAGIKTLGTAARLLITQKYNAPKLMDALIERYDSLIA